MKTPNRTLIAISVATLLTGSTLAALASTQSSKDQPVTGVVVEDVVVFEEIPTEVQAGSIRLKNDNASVMASKAVIDIDQATNIARTALPGQVIEAKLDDEHGFLVWEVEVINKQRGETQLKIDAGNGRLLAMAADTEDGQGHSDSDSGSEHHSWQFWKDNEEHDRD